MHFSIKQYAMNYKVWHREKQDLTFRSKPCSLDVYNVRIRATGLDDEFDTNTSLHAVTPGRPAPKESWGRGVVR